MGEPLKRPGPVKPGAGTPASGQPGEDGNSLSPEHQENHFAPWGCGHAFLHGLDLRLFAYKHRMQVPCPNEDHPGAGGPLGLLN